MRRITDDWSQKFGWEVDRVDINHEVVKVRLLGPPPIPDTDELTTLLQTGGVDVTHVVLEFTPETTVTLVRRAVDTIVTLSPMSCVRQESQGNVKSGR